jgi:outer membrane protein assembly factor BamB
LDDRDGHEIVHFLDALDGHQIWETELDLSHRDGFGIGPRCTPLMDGDRVYVQSAKGELRCLSQKDGQVLWRTNYVEDFGAVYIGEKGKAAGASRHGASGSPVIDGDRLIAQVGSEKGASVVAFNKMTGAVLWKSQNDQSAYAGLFLGPVNGGAHVVSFTAEGLIGLSPEDGHLLWRVPLKTALGRHVTTPVVSGSLALVASHQIGLVASSINTDEKGAWTAVEAWSNRSMGFNFSSPVIVGEHLYGLAPGKKVVCVALQTGQVVWEQEGLIQTSSDKSEAAFLVFKNRILMLNDTGELVLFHSDPSTYREAGRLQVCGKTWCNPAYANGRLYVRDERELVCVALNVE